MDEARCFIKRHHYSGSGASNSQLHLGIGLRGQMIGAMQFGPPIDKRKLINLVRGTGWNGFLELNRLALIDNTPKNTESRALSVAMKIIKRQYPHVAWVVSFADGTQCGDGTIYRAAGFILTGIKKNKQMLKLQGKIIAKKTLDNPNHPKINGKYFSRYLLETGQAIPLPGFQFRYLYFLDPTARQRLTVPEIPFSKISEMGAGMYKGRPKDSSEPPVIHTGKGGAAPTRTLHI